MKKFGFTLAEVLITLAIIGVVAAITLPSLNDDIGLKSIEKQTSKFYNTLVNAVSMIQAEEQVDDISSINLTPEKILSKMKVKQTCKVSDCAPAQYGFLNSTDKKSAAEIFSGTEKDSISEKERKIHLNLIERSNISELEDGALLYVSEEKELIDESPSPDNTLYDIKTVKEQPLTIYVDVNGKKGPNILGRDLWAISIGEDGKIGDTEVKTDKQTAPHAVQRTYKQIEGYPKTENLFTDECASLGGACFNTFRNNGFKFNCKK